MPGFLKRLATALDRLTCRHAWRYSRSRSWRTATEYCPRCGAVRRMPRGARFAAPDRIFRP